MVSRYETEAKRKPPIGAHDSPMKCFLCPTPSGALRKARAAHIDSYRLTIQSLVCMSVCLIKTLKPSGREVGTICSRVEAEGELWAMAGVGVVESRAVRISLKTHAT